MFAFNPLFPDATDEQKWDQIRLWRNTELARTDYTQLPDAPVDHAAWAVYRRELRDIDDSQSPDSYIPPTPPS